MCMPRTGLTKFTWGIALSQLLSFVALGGPFPSLVLSQTCEKEWEVADHVSKSFMGETTWKGVIMIESKVASGFKLVVGLQASLLSSSWYCFNPRCCRRCRCSCRCRRRCCCYLAFFELCPCFKQNNAKGFSLHQRLAASKLQGS